MSWFRSAHLKAGMILERDLSDAHGRLLYTAGTRLGSAEIERLHSLDLRGADVVDVDGNEPWPGRPGSHRFLDAADPYTRRLLKLSGPGCPAGKGKDRPDGLERG
jgi:hypothetical protein